MSKQQPSLSGNDSLETIKSFIHGLEHVLLQYVTVIQSDVFTSFLPCSKLNVFVSRYGLATSIRKIKISQVSLQI